MGQRHKGWKESALVYVLEEYVSDGLIGGPVGTGASLQDFAQVVGYSCHLGQLFAPNEFHFLWRKLHM